MDDALLQRVCGLAGALRQSAHLLLDHQHKLSLDTWTLGEIQEAFSLILEIEQHTNFHVLPPNHRQHPAIPQLQFIYDLLQKVHGLRLWTKYGLGMSRNETISLRCFRSLQALELDHIPITSLKALQTLRPSLRSIRVVRGLTQLSDLFIKCGADKALEFAWEQLVEAVLSHNSLHCLDNSLSLLPNLKILDLSHCELEDVSALDQLPCVSMLDVSHNHLRLLPRLSPTATHTLTFFVANNNQLSHVSGLHEMSNLEELDLRDNFLSQQQVLSPLGALPHIRILRISGNPLTCNINHRTETIKQLNPAVANHKVLLDNEPFTNPERSLVGLCSVPAGVPYPPDLLSSLSLLSSLCSPIEPFPTTPSSPPSVPFLSPEETPDSIQPASINSQPTSLVYESTSSTSFKTSGNGKKKSKRKVTRHINIADPDDDGWDSDSIQVANTDGLDKHVSLLGGTPGPPPPSLSAGSAFPTTTSNVMSQAMNSFTLGTETRPAAAEQSDRLLEEILGCKSPSAGAPMVPGETAPPTPSVSSTTVPQEGPQSTSMSTIVDENGEVGPGAVKVKEGEDEKLEGASAESGLESAFYQRCTNLSRQSSEDLTPPYSDSEDEKDDVQLILAKKQLVESQDMSSSEEEDGEDNLQDVILAITATHFKEKHNITARTLYKWELLCVESMELLSTSPHKILLTFSTIRPAYKTRTYILDLADYQSLSSVLTPILERNTLQEVLHSAMTCLKCQTQFSRDLAAHGGSLKCPNCGSGIVVHVDSVDHQAIAPAAVCHTVAPRSSTPVTHTLVQKAAMAQASESDSCPGESSESVSVCSEASSCVRRESDVEVISNPSVSSIEVLSEQQIIHEEGEEQKPPIPAVANIDVRTPANSPSTIHKPDSVVNMQESSSSGSMTGSVCTTYEKAGSVPTSPLKTSGHHTTLEIIDSRSPDDSSEISSLLYKTADTSLHASLAVTGTSPHSVSSSTSIDTVKNGGGAASFHHKGVMTSLPGDSTISEDVPQKSLASWVQSLLHTLTGYYWPWWEEVDAVDGLDKSINPIRYSYEDFSDVDHRLKLHCEVILFHEPGEQLLGLVKAILLIQGGKREFQGIVALSNKKLYILEIVGPEDDSPQSWLELMSSYNLSDVTTIHSLFQRQGLALTISDMVVLMSLADSHRSNCFFNFLSETLEERGVGPNIEECSPAQEEVLTGIMKSAVCDAESESVLTIFSIVSLLLDGGCSESQFLTMTDTDLLLFHADLEWYLPPSPNCKLALNQTQKIANITAIEVHSDSHIALQFLDEATGQESSWELHVTSSVAACHIIQAIRTPWTHLFSVDLQDFIGVYKTKDGGLLSMTRLLADNPSPNLSTGAEQSRCVPPTSQDWYQVVAVPGKLPYDPKYPILGYSDLKETPATHDQDHESYEVMCNELTDASFDVKVCREEKDSLAQSEKCCIYNEHSCETAPIFEENSNGASSVLF